MNILIALPCYQGVIQASCMLSVFALHRLLNEKHIPHALMLATNESLVTRVRNHFANMAAFDSGFEGREFSHLLFVDSDSVFDPKDILRMLEADKPIVAPESKN